MKETETVRVRQTFAKLWENLNVSDFLQFPAHGGETEQTGTDYLQSTDGRAIINRHRMTE